MCILTLAGRELYLYVTSLDSVSQKASQFASHLVNHWRQNGMNEALYSLSLPPPPPKKKRLSAFGYRLRNQSFCNMNSRPLWVHLKLYFSTIQRRSHSIWSSIQEEMGIFIKNVMGPFLLSFGTWMILASTWMKIFCSQQLFKLCAYRFNKCCSENKVIIMMINEALIAITIIADKNKTVTSFSNHFKWVWNCSLCFANLPFVKIWMEGTYDIPYKNPCFFVTPE